MIDFRRPSRWLLPAVTMLLIGATLVGFYAVRQTEERALRVDFANSSTLAESQLDLLLAFRVKASRLLAARLAGDIGRFRDEAEHFIEDRPGLVGLELVGASGETLAVSDSGPVEAPLHELRDEAIRRCAASQSPAVSPVVAGELHDALFLLVVDSTPASSATPRYLIASLDLRRLFQKALGREFLRQIHFVVRDGERVVLVEGSPRKAGGSGIRDSFSVEFDPGRLEVQVEPTEYFIEAHSSGWPIVVLLGGALTTVLVLLLARSVSNEMLAQRSLYSERESRIEESERAAAQLAKSEEEARQTFEQAGVGIAHVTPDGFLRRINQRLQEILGYGESELSGLTFQQLTHPDDLALDAELSRELLDGRRGSYTVEKRCISKAGSVVWVNMTAVLVRDEKGRPDYFISVIDDISRRKRLEGELVDANADLLDANQDLSEFAYIASHDLKEPLRGIHSYASFLIEDYREILPQEGRVKLEAMQSLAQRLETLIDTLLKYSRIGEKALAKKQVEVPRLIDDVRERVAEFLEGVELVMTTSFPPVVCDGDLISLVFQNLIVNAVKYNDSQPKRIELGVVDAKETAGGPVFFVKDNGIGIRERHQDKVFRLFKRLHARDEYGGGVGAGLTIVRKIIERHGGRIWFDSVEGEGSTFFFTLGHPTG